MVRASLASSADKRGEIGFSRSGGAASSACKGVCVMRVFGWLYELFGGHGHGGSPSTRREVAIPKAPPPPVPMEYRHYWNLYEDGPTLRRLAVPVCVLCKVKQTDQNYDELCTRAVLDASRRESRRPDGR